MKRGAILDLSFNKEDAVNKAYVQISIDRSRRILSYAVSFEPFNYGAALDPKKEMPIEYPCSSYKELSDFLKSRVNLSQEEIPPLAYFNPTEKENEHRSEYIYRTVPRAD